MVEAHLRGVTVRSIPPTWFALGAALVVALAAAMAGEFAPAVPLWTTEGCPKDADCFNNTPRLPLLPLIAGALYGVLVAERSWRGAVAGAGAGFAAVLVTSLPAAAAVALRDPYFQTAYRLYAAGYVLIAFAGLAAALAWVRIGRVALAWPIAAAVPLAVLTALLRGEWPIGAVAVVGGVAGAALALAARGSRAPSVSTVHVALAFAAVAFLARAVFGLQVLARTGPGMAFAIASDDGDAYYGLASSLARDGGRLIEVLGGLAFPPGYSLFLAGIFAATGESLAAVVVAQALLAALATLLVYGLGAALRDRGTGALAAGLFALDQNLIQNQSTLTAEALLIPTVLLSLFAFSRYRRGGRFRWCVLAALAVGLAFVTRNVVAMPLIIASLVWLAAWRRRHGGLLIRDIGVVIAAVLVASMPIAAASYAREGTPRITTQLAALAWDFDGGPGMTISNTPLIERGIRPLVDPWGSAARVLADPLPVLAFYVVAVPQRLSTLFFFLSPGSTDPLLVTNPLFYPNRYGDALTLLRVAALVVGLAAIVRARWWRVAPELGLVAAYVALYLAIFAFLFPPYHAFRYRIPVEPLRFIAEAGGLLLIAPMFWPFHRRADASAWPSARIAPATASETITISKGDR